MLLDNANIAPTVLRIGGPGVGEKFFYNLAHQLLYNAITRLHAEGKPVDSVILLDALGDNLAKVGGGSYISQLVGDCPYTEVTPYLDIVIRKRRERVRLRTAQKIITSVAKLNAEGSQNFDFITETDEFIRKDIFGEEESQTRDIKIICGDVVREWHQRVQSGGLLGKQSHLPRLDALLGGWVGGRLYVLGGRPGMGKTSVALQFGDTLVRDNERVCFVSLEMQDSDLIGRVVCQRAKINYSLIQTDPTQFSKEADWERLTNIFSELAASKWIENDRTALDVYQICTIIENAHNQSPLGIAIVDYLQLFAGIDEKYLVYAVAKACAVLRNCAKRLKIPIVLVSQLSRDVEKRRGDKRPIAADLRDSGGIEQVADAIIFVYRDVVYNRKIDTERAKAVAELIVAKNRHGPCGTVHCFFDARTTRFYADDYEFAKLALAGEYPTIDEPWLLRHRFVDPGGNPLAEPGGAAGTLKRSGHIDDDLPPTREEPCKPDDFTPPDPEEPFV